VSGALDIRPATAADLDDVMQVMAESFDPEFGEAWTVGQCASLLPMAGVWLTLAREGDLPVGFSLSRLIVGEAELLLLGVRRSAQRRGVGAKLLEKFIADARTRGAEKLHLEVRHGNHAVGLYRNAGFEEVGRRFNYYRGLSGHKYDALTLARSVAA
jgi:[ribosomal protein S18]-alanine N-acetyltransferase